MAAFELIFLGTGAADWPAKPNRKVRYDVSGTIRRTASLLVNGKYLIDPAPEAWFFATQVLKLDLSGLKAILLTHSHKDHFNHESLRNFLQGAKSKVSFFCHRDTIPWLKLDAEEISHIKQHPLEIGETVKLGDMTLQAWGANHEVTTTRETALHYLFCSGGKQWFYGCDGGWFLSRTWSALRRHKLDLVILEATVGNLPANYRIGTHNTLPMVELLLASMEECGIIAQDSLVVLSHLARGLHGPDEDYGRKIVARDGMRIEI